MRVTQSIRFFAGLLFLTSQVAYSATFSLAPGEEVVGETQTIIAVKNDSFASLANKYGLSLHEIKEANPHIKIIHPNQTIVLPTQFILPPAKFRGGIVINTPELRLYFFRPDGRTLDTYPVAMGRPGWRTPLMKTSVLEKEKDPTWDVPESIHNYMYTAHGINLPDRVPPGPRNPLGNYALNIGSGYLIHGNNQPATIGTYASSGCIRMHNKDIAELFPRVPLGTAVYITNHSYKAGWKGDKLFFSAQHPIDLNENSDNDLDNISPEEIINEAIVGQSVNINQNKVNLIIKQQTGVPKQINN
jgi:L,D-transpeptidase ErfK/SrfK